MPSSLVVAATAIGGALGASGVAATVVGGAVMGAVAGGVVSAVTGGNVLKGALIGAVAGGVGGYFGAGSTAAASAAGPTVEGLDAFYTAAPLATATTTAAAPALAGAVTPTGLLAGDYAKAAMIKGGFDFASGAAKAYGEGDAAEEQAKAEQEAEERRMSQTQPGRTSAGNMTFTTDTSQAMSYRNFFKPLEIKPAGLLATTEAK